MSIDIYADQRKPANKAPNNPKDKSARVHKHLSGMQKCICMRYNRSTTHRLKTHGRKQQRDNKTTTTVTAHQHQKQRPRPLAITISNKMDNFVYNSHNFSSKHNEQSSSISIQSKSKNCFTHDTTNKHNQQNMAGIRITNMQQSLLTLLVYNLTM